MIAFPKMKFGIQFRLLVLALVVALMGALITLATLQSQRRAAELRDGLNQVDSESFRIADQFRESLRELNNILQRYGISHEPAVWQEFLEGSHKLDLWIDEQKPKLKTPHELNMLQKIDASYDDYLRAARDLQARIQAAGAQSVPLAEFVPIRKESQSLMDLGQALAKAHYQSRNEIAARANQILSQFRWLTLGSLGLLFTFGIALAAVVYRELIAPLRLKLVESQTLIERHEKLASLGMLAAGVAHEIRNPLTAIKAALFIQQKKFQPGTQEHADSKIVEREISRLERIVNDFLLFARPSDPKLATLPADLLLLEVQQFYAPQFAERKIELVLEPNAPMHVRVDAAQIKQVLINLVKNAADAIGHEGKITLRARHDRRHLINGETNVVILEVADTGKGIPAEVQKRLFDPFFTTKEAGTGLGLPIASGIVQKHGGSLQYQTQVNYGTTFGIVLPQVTA